MSQHKARRPRRRLAAIIAALVAVVAAAAIGAGALVLQDQSPGSVEATDIPRYAPADADTLVVAPYSGSWWSKVGAMAPRGLQVQQLTPDAGLQIQHIGYSRSPDHQSRAVPGPLRVFYVEGPDAAAAARIRDWLKAAPGYDQRALTLEGRVVAVTEPWVQGLGAPKESMATVAGFKPDVTGKQAAMWFSPGLEVASLTGQPDGSTAKALDDYLQKGFGFTPGTAWSGTSRDGDNWSGKFASGGVDATKIDFVQASAGLLAQEKVIATVKSKPGKNGQATYQAVDPGPATIIGAALVSSPTQKSTLGLGGSGAMVPSLVEAPRQAQAVSDAQVSAVVDVARWDQAASGNAPTTEGVATRSISANGTEMNMAFGYLQ